MCGPKFCSMEITQQVREMAAAQEAGLKQKSEEFISTGAELYAEAK
jgi:phosphomethylpyrimidine synthase